MPKNIRYMVFGRLDTKNRRSLSKYYKTRREAERAKTSLKQKFPTRIKYARVKKVKLTKKQVKLGFG